MSRREDKIIEYKIGEGEKIIELIFLGDRNGDHCIPLYLIDKENKVIYDHLTEINAENKAKLDSILNKEFNCLAFDLILSVEGLNKKYNSKAILRMVIGIENEIKEIDINIYSNEALPKMKKGYTILRQKCIPGGLLETMIGKEESVVKKELDDLGFDCQTVRRDGVGGIVTCDIRSDRARMYVESGIVVDIWRE